MSVLFDLPDELCKEFVSEWLDYKMLGLLDTTVCSRKYRVHLLHFLAFFPGKCASNYGIGPLQWMNEKGVVVQELILDNKTTGEEWELALAPVWKKLKKLTVREGALGAEFAPDFNGCTNLEFVSFEYYDYIIPGLCGDFFKNLTHLELPCNMKLCNPKLLKVVRDHCRLLKTFQYIFDLTSELTHLLLDIVRLNESLERIKLPGNAYIIEELILLCSPRLISIELHGNVDFNTMVRVFCCFDKIDYVEISSSLMHYKHAAYTWSKQRLDLGNAIDTLDGWKNFRAFFPGIRELCLWGEVRYHFVNDDAMLSSIETLKMSHVDWTEEELKALLYKCSALINLSYHNMAAVNWPNVLKETNRIRILSITGPNKHLHYLLSACRYLTKVSFINCSISRYSEVPALVAAIEKYRHVTTGQPIECSCEIYADNGPNHTLYHLNYYGGQISGSLLTNYESLIEADKVFNSKMNEWAMENAQRRILKR